jgi:putative ABC transport system permease protein
MRQIRQVNLYYDAATAVSLALDSIRAHKLRSFLTLLGVIIGVASVILVGAAIDGLGVYAENITAKAFGSDSYLVAQIASVGRLTRRQLADKQRRNKRIRPDDVTYLRTVTGDSIMYSPYAQRFDDVKGENQVYEGAVILGVASTLPEMRDIPVEEGRFFTETEERMRKPVAVVGVDIRDTLFAGPRPSAARFGFPAQCSRSSVFWSARVPRSGEAWTIPCTCPSRFITSCTAGRRAKRCSGKPVRDPASA